MAKVDNNIKGRLALITGASGGLGSAIARNLILHDVDLALTYSTNELAIEELVAQLRKDRDTLPDDRYIRITTHKCDLSDADAAIALCEEVRKAHGRTIDILISNAGYGKRIRDIWDIPLEEFDHTLNVNLRATFILVKGVVEGMKAKKWGRIITIGSIAAYGAGINGAHYAASKGGLVGMSKNLASRLAEFGITVNDVAPAMVESGMMNEGSGAGEGETEPLSKRLGIPVGRLGRAEEVANAVEMFVKSGYVTGQSLLVAGGLLHH